jgi:membrane associated rhomboid family serine protease
MVVATLARVRRPPILTATAVTVAIGAAVAQYGFPAVVPALVRDLDALRAGQWWRSASPLLVQTLGWHQVVANLLALAVFGLVAEWLVGRWRWLVLFAAGTLGGQVAAYAWQEPGGGSSIAICGLAGGAAVTLLAGHGPVPRPFAHAVVYYVVALTGWGFSGIVAAGLGGLGAAAFLHGLPRLGVREVERVALAGAVACAAALAVAADLHGVSLISGMATMALLLAGQGVPPPWLRGRTGNWRAVQN